MRGRTLTGTKRCIAMAVAGGLAIALSAPAVAQFSDSYQVLEAVRKRDGTKATQLLDEDAVLVNTRDVSTGETPLLIAINRRDATWARFLLGRNADPNLADRSGKTPLMAAASVGLADIVPVLIQLGARVNADNTRGETALHLAVQRRDTAMIRALVVAGANPDQQDNIAGMSPREYARRDSRGTALLAAMEAPTTPAVTTPVGPVAGPR